MNNVIEFVCVGVFILFAFMLILLLIDKIFKPIWICRLMEWHIPNDLQDFDGVNWVSTCKKCGIVILQDSQGNWFGIGAVPDKKNKNKS